MIGKFLTILLFINSYLTLNDYLIKYESIKIVHDLSGYIFFGLPECIFQIHNQCGLFWTSFGSPGKSQSGPKLKHKKNWIRVAQQMDPPLWADMGIEKFFQHLVLPLIREICKYETKRICTNAPPIYTNPNNHTFIYHMHALVYNII